MVNILLTLNFQHLSSDLYYIFFIYKYNKIFFILFLLYNTPIGTTALVAYIFVDGNVFHDNLTPS